MGIPALIALSAIGLILIGAMGAHWGAESVYQESIRDNWPNPAPIPRIRDSLLIGILILGGFLLLGYLARIIGS